MALAGRISQAFPGWTIEDLGSSDRAYTNEGPYWVAAGRVPWDGPDYGRRWARVMHRSGDFVGSVLYGDEAVAEAIAEAERYNEED